MQAQIFYLILSTSFIMNTTANTTISSMTGASDRYSKCELKQDSGTITIDTHKHGLIKQSSNLPIPVKKIKELAPTAISSIGRPTHIWNPEQFDYFVANDFNELINFYSFGFRLVPNASDEASELIDIINKACAMLDDFKVIGDFEVKLKTGQITFLDKLVIKREKRLYESPYLTGEYSVPGSFTSTLTNISAHEDTFNFEIRVQEGSADYNAFFEATFTDSNHFVGKAYILPNNELLGTFEGKRI